jgi:hypothetical protein
VQALQHTTVAARWQAHLGERLGDGVLLVAVLGEHPMNGDDSRHSGIIEAN